MCIDIETDYLILPQPNAVHATKQGVSSLLLFALKRLSEDGKCFFFPPGGKRAQVSLTHLRIIQRVFLQTGNGFSDITNRKEIKKDRIWQCHLEGDNLLYPKSGHRSQFAAARLFWLPNRGMVSLLSSLVFLPISIPQ